MYIMYVDESGDPGKYTGNNSPHYILSGLIVSMQEWKDSLQRLKTYRDTIQAAFGLSTRIEIHSSELIRINKLTAYAAIRKSDRIIILKTFIKELPSIFPTGKIINICLNKEKLSQYDEFQELAWKRLIQRYDTFLKKDNSKGIIVGDDSNEPLLRNLIRKMRIYNPVTSNFGSYYNPVINNIIEDIFHRSSTHSYFIQAVDAIVHSLYRKEFPKGSLKKFGLQYLFNDLDYMLVKEASSKDPQGIVRQ